MILNKFNFKLIISLGIVHSAAIFVTPILLLITQNYWWAVLLLPSLLLTNTTWSTIHEGIHGNLNSNPQKNLWYSRCLAVLLHINFETSRFGHLLHHRYNRTDYDLTDGYDNGLKKKLGKIKYFKYKLSKTIIYYLHISIGIYLFEILGPLLLLLPSKWLVFIIEKLVGHDHEYVKNGKTLLLRSNRLKNIRIDNIINIIVLTYIFIIYSFMGAAWIILLFLFIRALLISSTDNLPHYGANLDLINGAFNLRTPKIWQMMILNFNYHRLHHKYPNITWDKLPKKFITEQDKFDKDYFRTYFKQWSGLQNKAKLSKLSKL